ncbi:MAG: T9SS type A sorting domain-containing protein [Imperialibacter sp.]|uniref:T9SS type A sorting domain-containing protein n=2 Tax=Imperialibacter TaxID=1649461 RepID=UPI003A86DBB2|tara:strand:- start:2158 stop:2661 length:504 start_codon:yes stop_codon:yes gene_type:complete
MLKSMLLVGFIFFTACGCFGQTVSIQTLNSGGASSAVSSGDLIVEWSVGEPFTNVYSAGNLVVSEGFQQFQLVETPAGASLVLSQAIKVYPNPFTDFIVLKAATEDKLKQQPVNARIYTTSGNIVLQTTFWQDEFLLETSGLLPGLYMIILEQNGKLLSIEKMTKVK